MTATRQPAARQREAATDAAVPDPITTRSYVLGIAGRGYEQQERFSWMGGHFTVPNEQKTQQSPSRGFRSVLQLSHS